MKNSIYSIAAVAALIVVSALISGCGKKTQYVPVRTSSPTVYRPARTVVTRPATRTVARPAPRPAPVRGGRR